MEIRNLEDLYIAELQELANVEGQLAECLANLAKAASHPALKRELFNHREETETQNERLESLLEKYGANTEAHVDQAMQALVSETFKTIPMLKSDQVRDASLISSLQRLKHYEIAAYGTVAALAGQLKLTDDQRLLRKCLEEEKRTDIALTVLAESEINPDALAA
jgi:ferritin-like metal-binding protein YciE